MTSMDFQTLPYLYVTISFLLEICFWGPTHPTFVPDVTNFTLFFGLDFPLGVQTLVLACSVMMMMESNYAVHVL